MTISDDAMEQAQQFLANISSDLFRAHAGFEDVVRPRYILPKAIEFPLCWSVLLAKFSATRPAATMICAALADLRTKIEIEVTPRRQKRS